jgi:hypothetical protein
MYLPHAFTHQGVHGPGKAYRYPGEIDGKRWDKAQLEAALRPVVEFQRKYNVHIYIGEFSAIRWAPDDSACRYLADLIDIFEAHAWDWSLAKPPTVWLGPRGSSGRRPGASKA